MLIWILSMLPVACCLYVGTVPDIQHMQRILTNLVNLCPKQTLLHEKGIFFCKKTKDNRLRQAWHSANKVWEYTNIYNCNLHQNRLIIIPDVYCTECHIPVILTILSIRSWAVSPARRLGNGDGSPPIDCRNCTWSCPKGRQSFNRSTNPRGNRQ